MRDIQHATLGVVLKITRFESDDVFDALATEWDALLVDSAADQIFLRHAWLSTWWAAYRPGEIWTLAVRDEAGTLQGLAPWFIHTEGDGNRLIRPVGCVDVTDYLEVIARRGHEDAVFGAIADYLAEHAGEFNEIRLCNVPQESPFLAQMPALLEAHGFSVATRVEDVCPVVPLPGEFTAYLGQLDKKDRHELRRKLRRAGTTVDWYIVGSEHDLDDEITRFMELMAASNPEKAAFLENEQHRTFFRTVVPKIAAGGWLQLAFLTVGEEAAASYINFVYNGRVMVYNSGHDPANHASFSPGIVLLARLIEHAIEAGHEVFDFLRGDETYKFQMGGQETSVFRMTIQPGG